MQSRPGLQQGVYGTPQPQQPQQPKYTHVLYISQTCSKSMELLKALQSRPLAEVLVQDINKIVEKPAWLSGSPIVADVQRGLIYKGSDAIACLQQLFALHHPPEVQQPVQPVAPRDPFTSFFEEPELVMTDKMMEKYGAAGKRGGISEQHVSQVQERYSSQSKRQI